jgi:cation:H+ antiporter
VRLYICPDIDLALFELVISIVGIFIGLAMLLGGANWLIEGAAGIALRARVSPHLIGVSLVAAATSLPELATSISASITGHNGIVVGNIVGSNAFNVGVVLAVGAIILRIRSDDSVKRDGIVVTVVTIAFALMAFDGFSRIESGIIFLAYIGYTIYLFKTSKIAGIVERKQRSLPILIGVTVLGIALLVAGSPILVESSVFVAHRMGVSDTFIGLTIIAIGTSLPELLTSVIAALKKETGIAIGNVLGSNIFNILVITGISGMIHPLAVTNQMAYAVIPGMLLVTLLGVILTRKTIGRREGILLLISYGLFMVLVIP